MATKEQITMKPRFVNAGIVTDPIKVSSTVNSEEIGVQCAIGGGNTKSLRRQSTIVKEAIVKEGNQETL